MGKYAGGASHKAVGSAKPISQYSANKDLIMDSVISATESRGAPGEIDADAKSGIRSLLADAMATEASPGPDMKPVRESRTAAMGGPHGKPKRAPLNANSGSKTMGAGRKAGDRKDYGHDKYSSD